MDVRDLVGMTGKLYVKVIAKSGSALVDYYGIGSEKFGADGLWDAIVPITASSEDGQNFFQPFTTTLIELRLNRDPKPFTADRVKLCYFGEWGQDGSVLYCSFGNANATYAPRILTCVAGVSPTCAEAQNTMYCRPAIS